VSVFKQVATFVIASTGAYMGLAIVFRLNCVLGGHNSIEMLYGSFANILLAVVAGALFTWSANYSGRTSVHPQSTD